MVCLSRGDMESAGTVSEGEMNMKRLRCELDTLIILNAQALEGGDLVAR